MMKGSMGEWIRWLLAAVVIPLGLMVIDLRETIALQGKDIAGLQKTLTEHIQADGQRIEKITERGLAQNDNLIKANEALTALKERLDDLLESLRASSRRSRGG